MAKVLLFSLRSNCRLNIRSCNLQSTKLKGSIADFYGSASSWKGETDFSKKYSVKPDGKFEGYIPVDKIDFRYTRSSGAGGQHVNKINTKVEARFHVENADWIPEEVRSRLKENQQSRITKDGYLVVTSEKTRKQIMNKADVLSKLRKMIFDANEGPPELSEEYIEILKEREEKRKEANIRLKKERALKRSYKRISPSEFR